VEHDWAPRGSIWQERVDAHNLDPANFNLNIAVGGFQKRLFDLVMAICAIIVLSPVVLIVATLILVVDGRPILIKQSRIGKGGTAFLCFKFRTMIVDSDDCLGRYFEKHQDALLEWRSKRKLISDPRVTA
jgi:exopolysaccharide production protein ExoY